MDEYISDKVNFIMLMANFGLQGQDPAAGHSSSSNIYVNDGYSKG
jgi:hypothetical protein